MLVLWRTSWGCPLSSYTSEYMVIDQPVANVRYSSLLSAFGMALADVAVDNSEPLVAELEEATKPLLVERFAALKELGKQQLLAQDIPEETIKYECFLNLRYQGSDTRLMISEPDDGDYAKAFVAQHKREFAFNLEVPLDVQNIRVRAVGQAETRQDAEESPFVKDLETLTKTPVAKDAHFATNDIFFEELNEYVRSPMYRLDALEPGTVIQGPAVLLDATQTILLHPHNKATILTKCVQ